MSSQRELVEIALRILVVWVNGQKAAPADVHTLREAFPRLEYLPDDDLAVRVIHDLSSAALREEPWKADDVV